MALRKKKGHAGGTGAVVGAFRHNRAQALYPFELFGVFFWINAKFKHRHTGCAEHRKLSPFAHFHRTMFSHVCL